MIATDTLPEIGQGMVDYDRDDIYIPSPAEIREACALIQADWTEAERARRARGQAGRQRTVPVAAKRYARLLLDNKNRDGWAA